MPAFIQRSLLFLFALAALSVASAQTQKTPVAPTRPELALDYTFLHSNAPPSLCGCFSLNGGSAAVAFPLRSSRWDLAGDVTFGYTRSVSTTGKSLSLSTYTAGPRYYPRIGSSPLHPFVQVLAGLAHAGGATTQGPNATATSGAVVFAANLGGGLDLQTGQRLHFRLLEVDDSITTFNNNVNNYQNILRVSSGVVFRLGR